jgi:hypothetical protein
MERAAVGLGSMTEAQITAIEASRCLWCKEIDRLFQAMRFTEHHGLTAAYGVHRQDYQAALANRRALDELLFGSEEKTS